MTKFLLKIAFFTLPVIIGFGILFRLGFSPVVTDSMYLDHKLFWIPRHPIPEPRIMAIGSSMTLYSIDSHIFTDSIHASYFNFASWHTQIGDTKVILQFLLDQYHPSYIIFCTTPSDFAGIDNPTIPNLTRPGWLLLHRCPQLFFFTTFPSLHQIAVRNSRNRTEYVDFDPWGGGVGYMVPPKANHDNAVDPTYGRNAYTLFSSPNFPRQYKALDSICTLLQVRGITLIFAQAPIKPSFLDTDSLQRLAAHHFDRCEKMVRKHGGIYLNYTDTTLFRDSLFRDPIHLETKGAMLFTKKLVADLKGIIK
jgi:hypothetical protein